MPNPAAGFHALYTWAGLSTYTGATCDLSVNEIKSLNYRAYVTSQERYGVRPGQLDIPDVDSVATARRIHRPTALI